jgi:hypothetical protein
MDMDLRNLAPEIMSSMIPQSRLTAADQAVLVKHETFLMGLTEDLVKVFYDAAYGHTHTAEIFVDGERRAREETLRDWWTRTVSKPIDDDYYRWMTLVGVVHIRRRVTNPMMLGMIGYVTQYVSDRARDELSSKDAIELTQTLGRLQNVLGSLISDSYTQAFIGALESLAGLTPALTERMLRLEIGELEQEGRESLA